MGQVAFSFLLLVTAALFLRSIGRAYDIDPGFQTAHLAVFMTNPGQAGYREPQTKAFYKEVRERVARVPGVESVSWASNMPLWARTVTATRKWKGGNQRSQADKISTIVNTVDRNYFETAGVAIDSGREFTNLDQETSTPVAIVNEKLAHDYWPGGKRWESVFSYTARNRCGRLWESPERPIIPTGRSRHNLRLRTAGTELFGRHRLCMYAAREIRRTILIPSQREIRAAGPQILVSAVRTGQRDRRRRSCFRPEWAWRCSVSSGCWRLALASIGLYGIQAYSVNQRKREIGLRMALGAAHASVLRLILKQGMSLVLTGVLIGFVAALFVGQLLSSMLYGVSPSDPISIAVAAAVLLAVALLACYLPARRATRVDPIVALREG